MGYKLALVAFLPTCIVVCAQTPQSSKDCRACTSFDSTIDDLFGSTWKPGTSPPAPTRAQVIQAAMSIVQTTWTPAATNVSLDVKDDFAFQECRTYFGIPYMWGSRDGSRLFCNRLLQGRAVLSEPGAQQKEYKLNYTNEHVTGIDCVGFVTYCWGLKGRLHNYNTTAIKKEAEEGKSPLFVRIDENDLKPGDAYVSDHHILLFEGYSSRDGVPIVCEAPRASGLANCNNKRTAKNFNEFVAVRYRPIVDSSTPEIYLSPERKVKPSRPQPPQTRRTPSPPLRGHLTYTSLELDFGLHKPRRDEIVKSVTLRNTGPVAVKRLSLTWDGNEDQSFRVTGPAETLIRPNNLMSLQPGTELTINLSFVPVGVGDYAAKLTLSSDAEPNTVVVIVRGSARLPILTFSSQTIDFGLSKTNARRPNKVLVIRNEGQLPIENIALSWADNRDGVFQITGEAETLFKPNNGMTIEPGKTLAINLSLSPATSGDYVSRLSLSSDARPSLVSFSLRGSARDPVVGTDYSGPIAFETLKPNGYSGGCEWTFRWDVNRNSG